MISIIYFGTFFGIATARQTPKMHVKPKFGIVKTLPRESHMLSRKDFFIILSFYLPWGLLFLLFPPWAQNFPLNDSWAYTKGLFHLLEGQGLTHFGPSVPLVGQWLYQAPFVLLFGPSHFVLRVSTLLLSFLGSVAFFFILTRQMKISRGIALLATATLSLSPLTFLLSGTAMTDIPTLSFSLISLALFVQAQENYRLKILGLASLVACFATATRPNAILLPFSVAISFLFLHPSKHRMVWSGALLLPFLGGLLADLWFSQMNPDFTHLTPTFHSTSLLVFYFFSVAQMLGLFLFPMSFPLFFETKNARQWLFWGGMFILTTAYGWSGKWFPYWGNMITPWGQYTVNDVVVGERSLIIPLWLQVTLSYLATFGVCGMFSRGKMLLKGHQGKHPLYIFCGLHLMVFFFAPYWFDRYLLILFPGFLALMAKAISTKPFQKRLCKTLLFTWAIVSTALMHDWLSWNQARWTLGNRALNAGVAVSDIEGGLEWNGWHSPQLAKLGPFKKPENFELPYTKRLFPHISGEYALSFSPLPHAKILDQEPYTSWLSGNQKFFYLIERDGSKLSDH